MLDFPIVDTHLHLWNPGEIDYPWLSDVPKISGPHLLDDYNRALGPVEVDGMVFLQCECEPSQYQQETAWVSALAGEDPRIRGIVSWAPLERGDAARADLEALAANPLVRGIRRIIQFEDDPDFCLRPDFIRGVQMLGEFAMSFDVCLKGASQTTSAIRLIEQCPDVSFMLDHIGKPMISEGRTEPWRRDIRRLGALPNVCCKMSGVATEADVDRWKIEDVRPYIEHVVECFGFERVAFGGDWPVVTLASDYPRWVRTLLEIFEGARADEIRSIFRETAIRFYRL
ncbi:MAG: amidohydrolase [Phycisphaeraceae bacterium]|nr:amidohydrolase [Phycisphaeraceae bacterium]